MAVHLNESPFMSRQAKPLRRRSIRHVVREGAREAFRTALLEAAERVFEHKGFGVAKMADIAKEAGVAVGTLYNYFDSKTEIFRAILVDGNAEFREHLAPALEQRDPIKRITELVRRSFECIEQHGALFAIYVELGGIGEYDIARVGGPSSQVQYQEFLQKLTDAVEAAVAERKLRRDIPVATMVASLSGAMNGAVYSWLRNERRDRLSEGTDNLMTLFLTGASR